MAWEFDGPPMAFAKDGSDYFMPDREQASREPQTCDKCIFWRSGTGIRGACQKHDKIEYDYGQALAPDGLAYSDYEGYSASHSTGPKFGCIHFVKRP